MTEIEILQEKLDKSEAANADLVTSIGKLEKANADLVSERTTLKGKLKDNASDETLKAENDNLLKQIAGQDERLAELTSTHKTELNAMKMVSMFDELNETGISADSKAAKDILIPLLLEGADLDSDDFRYVGEDDTTLFKADNIKYGLIDKVNDLKDSGYGGLFKQATGGGKQTTDAKPTANPSTDAERVADLKQRHNIQ